MVPATIITQKNSRILSLINMHRMSSYSNAQKDVEDNLMQMSFLNMRKYVRKFSSQKEKYSTLPPKDN